MIWNDLLQPCFHCKPPMLSAGVPSLWATCHALNLLCIFPLLCLSSSFLSLECATPQSSPVQRLTYKTHFIGHLFHESSLTGPSQLISLSLYPLLSIYYNLSCIKAVCSLSSPLNYKLIKDKNLSIYTPFFLLNERLLRAYSLLSSMLGTEYRVDNRITQCLPLC